MSAHMRQEQQRRLLETKIELDTQWVSHLEDVEADYSGYTIIVAHEFFDALPIHIYEKRETGLHELKVDLAADEEEHDFRSPFHFVLSPQPVVLPFPALRVAALQSEMVPGSRLEFSPISYATASYMARLIGQSGLGGSALIIDYGKDSLIGDTFRAFKNHEQVHPLESPGSADLTASVNFALLKAAALESEPSVAVHGSMSQALFLTRMGLHTRLQQLMIQANKQSERDRIESGGLRLVNTTVEGRGGMGKQYSVLAMTCERDNASQTAVYPFVEYC